ncbi:MAG: NAD(P)H-binding protein [Actinomycetota bacterium]
MSVAVVGASGVVGPAVVASVAARDPSVKALVRRPEAVDAARAAGAKVAVGELDDVATLEAVLRGSETVCHLVGGVNEPDEHAYDASSRASAERVVQVATRVGVRRILLLSAFGAAPESPNPFLRAKGRAEHLVATSGLEYSVLRTAPIYGPGGFWFTATVLLAELDPPAIVGEPSRPVTPVFVDDVAAALAAMDDRQTPVEGPLTLSGPHRVTAAELGRMISGRPDVRSLDPMQARTTLSDLLGRPVAPAALELLAAPVVPDPRLRDAAELLGIAMTPLREGLARVASHIGPHAG